MKIYAFETKDWEEAAKNGLAAEVVTQATKRALETAKKLLPSLSEELNVAIWPHERGVIPEYGTGGRAYDAGFIEVTFDKTAQLSAEKILRSIEQTIFHEANHAARWNAVAYDDRFIASIVFEGLATVFERDYAEHLPLYGKYDDDEVMEGWLAELRSVEWSRYDDYFYNHPDGRRWIGYKAGAWVVDKAMKNSGKNVIDLSVLPADEIFRLAGFVEEKSGE